MPDFDYEMRDINLAYPVQAMRRSTLDHLVTQEAYSKHNLLSMTQEVMTQWRARVSALHDIGWDRVQDANYYYARNCPPFGVKTETKARVCTHLRICPWCWARMVTSLCWDKLLQGTFASKNAKEAKVSIPGMSFLSFSYEKSFDLDELEKAVMTLKRDRMREVHSVKSSGAYVVQTIWPNADYFTLVRRGLIVMKPGMSLEEFDIRTDVLDKVDRPMLVKVVGYICKYPVAMMRCKPEQAIEVMAALKNVRVVATSGLFHGNAKANKRRSGKQQP